MTTSWLASLPQRPLREGYTVRPAEEPDRSEWEAGPGRQRRRSTRIPFQVELAWRMDREQFESFRSFYKHDLVDGTAWFALPLPLGAAVPTCEARFRETYRAAPWRRAAWQVTAALEAWLPAVDPGAIAGLTTAWPAALDFVPVAEGYALDPHEATLRSESEDGPLAKRRRFVDTPARIDLAWRFEGAGFALWLNWWRGVLLDGRRWAQIPVRLGEAFATCNCRFLAGNGGWRATLWRGLYWQVTAELEVRRLPVAAPAGDLLLTEAGDFLLLESGDFILVE